MLEKYIFSIIVFSVFALILIVWLASFFYNKKKESKRREELEKMYNDENLAKMEYDFAPYDEKTARLANTSRTEGQLSIYDVMIENAANSSEEGLEEITGNYKPE